MKISEYVAARCADLGVFKGWRVVAWALWALLVKPERFWVGDLLIELQTGGGQVRRLLAGVAQILLGFFKVFFSACGIALLLAYLLLSPLGIVLMHLAARFITRRNLRRRAKLLAEARAGMVNRTEV
jgi:hypothetical protein